MHNTYSLLIELQYKIVENLLIFVINRHHREQYEYDRIKSPIIVNLYSNIYKFMSCIDISGIIMKMTIENIY